MPGNWSASWRRVEWPLAVETSDPIDPQLGIDLGIEPPARRAARGAMGTLRCGRQLIPRGSGPHTPLPSSRSSRVSVGVAAIAVLPHGMA